MENNKQYTSKSNTRQQSWRSQANGSSDTTAKKVYPKKNVSQKYVNPNAALKSWVTRNVQTLTLALIKQYFVDINDDEKKFYVITQLIDNVSINNNIISVLEEMEQNKLISKRQNKDLNKYGYFHKAAYIKSGCDLTVFERLVKLLYSCGFNPFTTNDRVDDDKNHETALMGLFQVNNKLLDEERVERYKIILYNMPSNIMPKILQSYLNKISFENKDTKDVKYLNNVVDITRFFLCMNPDQTMNVLANFVLINEYKDEDLKIGTCCLLINNKVNFILKILSGADDNYAKTRIFDKSVEKFFDLQEKKCFNMDILLDIFYRKAQSIIINTVNQNKKRNNVSFVRMIGSFCSNGKFITECNIQINNYFEDGNIDDIIHMICHIGYATEAIKEDLLHATSNIRHITAIDGIFNTVQDKKYNFKQVKIMPDHLNVYEYKKLTDEYYDKMEIIKTIKYHKIQSVDLNDTAWRCFVKRIEDVNDELPNDKQLIIRQIIATLLEHITSTEHDKIPNIIGFLLNDKLLDKNIVLNEEYYFMNLIKSDKLDCSVQLSLNTWTLIFNSL